MTATVSADMGSYNQDVVDYARQRGITEVLHFTTSPNGLTGICATGGILCADRLPQEALLEHILKANCADRLKDADWTGYVNMSLSRVNKHMLDRSVNWHRHEDLYWAVLAFDPAVLGAPGVQFTTTNNTYHSCVRRGPGVDALEALFAPSVEWGYYGSMMRRWNGMPDAWTTDPQAEILYPNMVPLEHLTAIYVNEPEHVDDVHGITRVFPATGSVPVHLKPEVFA